MIFKAFNESQGEVNDKNLQEEVYNLALDTGNIHQENFEEGCSVSHLSGTITEPTHILGFSHIIKDLSSDSKVISVGYLKLEGRPSIIAGIYVNKTIEPTEIDIFLLDSNSWNNVQACDFQLTSNSDNQLERVAASIGINKEITESGIRIYDTDGTFETVLLKE